MEIRVNPDQFIRILDKNAYFEVVTLSEDDKHRNEMYKANAMRKEQEESFGNYSDFLKSLEMEAVIRGFEPVYYSRIAQLTNKSNQFNLTTKRMTQAEVEQMAQDPGYITLYGKLKDKFGDNGVVSLVIGKKNGDTLELILWLMSCRVLKQGTWNRPCSIHSFGKAGKAGSVSFTDIITKPPRMPW